MSSTRKRKRAGVDNYPTPKWAIRRFFERWDESSLYDGALWIEPSVGSGAIVQVANEHVMGIDWTVCDRRDIRPYMLDCDIPERRVTIGDFLNNDFETKSFDVCIMNPPFYVCAAFIDEAHRIANTVICFQSLNLLGSAERADWMKRHVPDTYVLPDRVSHTGDGQSDSVCSAWFVWETGKRRQGRIQVLDTTSLQERKRDSLSVNLARDERKQVLDSLFYEARF